MELFNYYILIFIIGSFLGFILESLWCYIKNNHLESRKGLIYSPLIPIYGIAALLITLVINLIKIKNMYLIFILGISISAIVEYNSSLIQEKVFHTRSWDYSEMRFNLHGRVNLIYTIMFGIIALMYCKFLLPKYNLFFNKISSPQLNILCVILVIFLIYDIIISSLACFRMKERKLKIERTNKFWKYFDHKYPDEYLTKIYTNMQFLNH